MDQKDYEETKKALYDTRVAATQSRETALAFLMKMGMVDENGDLTPEYNHKQGQFISMGPSK